MTAPSNETLLAQAEVLIELVKRHESFSQREDMCRHLRWSKTKLQEVLKFIRHNTELFDLTIPYAREGIPQYKSEKRYYIMDQKQEYENREGITATLNQIYQRVTGMKQELDLRLPNSHPAAVPKLEQVIKDLRRTAEDVWDAMVFIGNA